jgi:hypothetical protein
MNDQDHSLSLSDPDRSLVLSHLLVNFLKNLVSCQTSLRFFKFNQPKATGGGFLIFEWTLNWQQDNTFRFYDRKKSFNQFVGLCPT